MVFISLSEKDYEHEAVYLEETLGLIDGRLEKLGASKRETEAYLYEQRKYMWQELPCAIRSFDDAAALVTQNEAMSRPEISIQEKDSAIRIFKKMRNSPYFGRIDFEEDGHEREKVYFGLSNLMEQETKAIKVCDWRAPIASLFYENAAGRASYTAPGGVIEGEVSLMRQYRIERGELEQIIESDLRIEDHVLQEALGHVSSDHMRTIVSSIQREQNVIIRDAEHSVLLVLGPAGSGKTSVALHRVAYLLYRDRERLTSDNILIFSPNDVFSEYISDIMPELGERAVLQTTFAELTAKYCGRHVTGMYEQIEFIHAPMQSAADLARLDGIRLKGSLWFLDFAKRYIENYVPPFCDVIFEGKRIISKEALYKMYLQDYAHILPAKRLESIKVMIFHRFGPTEQEFRRVLRHELAAECFDEMQLLTSCKRAYDETMAATNAQIATNTELDVFSLYADILREAISAWPGPAADREELLRGVDDMPAGNTLYFEDGVGVLLVGALTGAIPRPRRVHHVVIDEIQDFSPAQHAIISYLFDSSKLTLLGDAGQIINPWMGMAGGEEILKIYGRKGAGLRALTRSYRSTIEINRFAERALEQPPGVDYFERHGAPVAKRVFRSARKQAQFLAGALAERKDLPGTTAVLCRTRDEAQRLYAQLKRHVRELRLLSDTDMLFRSGLWVMPIAMAKGLEFDRVYLANTEEYGEEKDRGLLYVACTRAMHELTVCGVGALSALLGGGDE